MTKSQSELPIINKLADTPNTQVAFIGETHDRCVDFIRRCTDTVDMCGIPVRRFSIAECVLEFDNKSKVVAVPKNKPDAIRGQNFDYAIFDETISKSHN